MASLLYFDTSALIKLLIKEQGSEIVERCWRDEGSVALTSALTITELRRAAARISGSCASAAPLVVDGLVLVELCNATLENAGALPPPTLRSLDAIHLATALALEADLEALVTFDKRLADAARGAGLTVVGA